MTDNTNYSFISNNIFYSYVYNNTGTYVAVPTVSVANDIYSFNVSINTTSLSISNSTVSFTLTSPTAAQISGSNYYLNANGQWAPITGGSGSINTAAQYTFTNTITFANTVILNAISANGTIGTSGQILTSNGTDSYWSTLTYTGTVTSIASGNGISGGPITSSGTLYINANSGIVSNTSGIFVDSTYIGTLTSNNTNFVGTVSAANVVSNTQLQANIQYFVNTSQLSTNLTNYQTTAGLSSNVATLTANNTNFVGTVSAANVVSNTQLQSNLANYVNTSQLSTNLTNYQTTAGLSSNVATLTANNTSFVGTVSAANVVSNTQLSGNLANYQTTAGLSANVATLAANNTSYLGGVAAASYVNTSGSYTISGIHTHSANINLNNNINLRFQTVNSTAYAYFIQQNDDNFVFYTSNTTYGARPVFSIFANSVTSNLNFAAPVYFNGNVGFGTVGIFANGTTGTTGQVLTSNGTSAYWSTPAGGSFSNGVSYTWTAVQTFQANVLFTGNGASFVTNTGSVYFNGMADANWRIGRNTGGTTKFYYSNNTLDIIAAASNLEGIAIGQPGGNTYIETGYAGTFTRNPVYVGNTTVNTTITSSSIALGNSISNVVANSITIVSSFGYSNPNTFVMGSYTTVAGINTVLAGPFTIATGNTLVITTGSRVVIV